MAYTALSFCKISIFSIPPPYLSSRLLRLRSIFSLILIQQFQNGICHLLLGVPFREKSPQVLHPKTNMLGLIGFFFRHNRINTFLRKRTLLCRLLHTDTLCVGRGTVIQAHSVKQYPLRFFGQIGKLYGGAEGDDTVVHLL